MKTSTVICIGFRNVGTKEPAEFFEGTMIDSMKWLIGLMSKVYMRNSIRIAIGRNQDEVELGLGLKKSGAAKADMQLKGLLASLMVDDSEEETNHQIDQVERVTKVRDPEDDYQG